MRIKKSEAHDLFRLPSGQLVSRGHGQSWIYSSDSDSATHLKLKNDDGSAVAEYRHAEERAEPLESLRKQQGVPRQDFVHGRPAVPGSSLAKIFEETT